MQPGQTLTFPSGRELLQMFRTILGPERDYYKITIGLGIAISLLTLAVPVSVQMLIDTVANTALVEPVILLSLSLFALLALSGVLYACRVYIMELFERRFYARLSADIALRAVYASTPFFEERRRSELFNRYFDITSVQKLVPELLVGAFSILLQAVIGFIVVSLYHPFFLTFNVLFIFLLVMIWITWGRGAIRASLELSHAKYANAHWLEGLADNNSFFKERRHINFALERADQRIDDYLAAQRKHFSFSFAQTISLLALYALASSSLLGLGGWLIIQGQLSLGQLVAAELILAGVFLSFSQYDVYLEKLYLLCAATEELMQVHNTPLEKRQGTRIPTQDALTLEFNGVVASVDGQTVNWHLTLPGGSKVLATAENHRLQRLFTGLLQRYLEPDSGWITLGGEALGDCDMQILRERISIIDNLLLIDCTIDEYFQLANPLVSRGAVSDMLERLELGAVIRQLPDGFATLLDRNGWPLSSSEILRLKLAASLLADPLLLVIGPELDLLEPPLLRRTHDHLSALPRTTVILFSPRLVPYGFNQSLNLSVENAMLTETSARRVISGEGNDEY